VPPRFPLPLPAPITRQKIINHPRHSAIFSPSHFSSSRSPSLPSLHHSLSRVSQSKVKPPESIRSPRNHFPDERSTPRSAPEMRNVRDKCVLDARASRGGVSGDTKGSSKENPLSAIFLFDHLRSPTGRGPSRCSRGNRMPVNSGPGGGEKAAQVPPGGTRARSRTSHSPTYAEN